MRPAATLREPRRRSDFGDAFTGWPHPLHSQRRRMPISVPPPRPASLRVGISASPSPFSTGRRGCLHYCPRATPLVSSAASARGFAPLLNAVAPDRFLALRFGRGGATAKMRPLRDRVRPRLFRFRFGRYIAEASPDMHWRISIDGERARPRLVAIQVTFAPHIAVGRISGKSRPARGFWIRRSSCGFVRLRLRVSFLALASAALRLRWFR